MALAKKPTAAKTEPEGTTTKTPVDEARLADQPKVDVDADGNAVNPGDSNATPATPAQPQSALADENQQADETKGVDEAAKAASESTATSAQQAADDAAKEAADKAASAEAEKKLADEKAAAADSQAKEASKDKLVTVTNISSQNQRQFSTGLWIASGATEKLANDGWLKAQVDAGLFILGKRKD